MDKIIDVQTAKLILKEDQETRTIEMFEHKGVWFADTNVGKATLDLMPTWQARKEDVFVVTFPKAGTTWAQEIMYLALNRADIEKANQSHTMLRVPYLEANIKPPKLDWFSHPWRSIILLWCLLKMLFRMIWYNMNQGRFLVPSSPYEIINQMPSPRFLKSHLPDHLLPPDIFEKKAKIVYVARNPKDLAVSDYHFHRWQPMLPKYESWDKFLDDFMTGKVTYGKWYEHYLGFWKRRHEDNILFLKYEDMKKDEKAAVKQICEFLGYHYSDRILDRITEHSTFKNMKKNPMANPDTLTQQGVNETSFMRKGEVGDWKNYFTDAQSEAFNALCEEKLAGTGLDFNLE